MTRLEKKEAIIRDLRAEFAATTDENSYQSYRRTLIDRKNKLRTTGVYDVICVGALSWPNGQYALGLLAAGDEESIALLTAWYDKILGLLREGLFCFERPDHYIHAGVIAQLYRRYGIERYRELLDDAARNVIYNRLHNVILYGGEGAFLVDTLGMIPDFCYSYSQITGDPTVQKIAEYQVDYAVKLEKECGTPLPKHYKHVITGEIEGNEYWGRGSGWFILGLVYAALSNPERFGAEYVRAIHWIFDQADENGYLFDDHREKNHVDTSTTSMAAMALLIGLKNGLIPEEDREKDYARVDRAIDALLLSTDENGKVNDCSGECGGAGAYSTRFGNFFAQGYTVALLNEKD